MKHLFAIGLGLILWAIAATTLLIVLSPYLILLAVIIAVRQ